MKDLRSMSQLGFESELELELELEPESEPVPEPEPGPGFELELGPELLTSTLNSPMLRDSTFISISLLMEFVGDVDSIVLFIFLFFVLP